MTILIASAAAIGVFAVTASTALWAIATYDRGRDIVGPE